MAGDAGDPGDEVPVLLLKTKSAPADGYEDLFLTLHDHHYKPVFVPVLEHRFKQDALDQVRHYITSGTFGNKKYGGLVFTSQRAVEAFARVVKDIQEMGCLDLHSLLPPDMPLYVVGPATARGLRALNLPCPILGEETGNGHVLSQFILEHYNSLHPSAAKPSILFLVGEKRRDIIPKTLQSENLDPERRAVVDELVIYETGEMQSFKTEFSALWHHNHAKVVKRQWAVVFSPTGCRAMLESLQLLDIETGRVKSDMGSRNILIATIGPTTRDYLEQEFGFSPDVSAEHPSPEGLVQAIASYKDGRNAAETTPNKDDGAAGAKRKADKTSSPQMARDRKAPKKQATIEETLGADHQESNDKEMEDSFEHGTTATADDAERAEKSERVKETQQDGNTPDFNDDTNESGAIEESSERGEKVPSNILEKGIIYFLVRNRVGMEEADSVGDLQRTFFVLRPIPSNAKLGDGTIPDSENNRLFALPKKSFPKSHNDRFMAFVEKANTTIQDLKENFFKGVEYETQTAGTRHQQPITPVGEGVYAITRTEDRTTHLAYAVTIPSKLGEVQRDLGLRSQGSFVISAKNPERPGPASARLPQAPGFPKEIIEEFRGLAWSEVKPKYLDYANAQILLIGENSEHALGAIEKDRRHDKAAPKEELDELEHEDELRVKHLSGDDSVFDDLGISKKDYAQVPTTW
ncbi:tetrapyrrole biosynthesis, uroporphyrinogen III synthase [Polyplosphaeria fusca]|uniref:Tetrapyrrole biosynthesis, uroporphyrinogen III synthase n=1 Tax=Polyplosphaeria fusca TaxID=682080 RepID=A0A9P4RAN5_9PLEO|nr:tetrapyrrole biosynthesis, uroporphyrinogen III synthase [Polyplosphaeria fusca]